MKNKFSSWQNRTPSPGAGLFKLEMWNLIHPPSAGQRKFVYGGVVWIKSNEVDQSGMF